MEELGLEPRSDFKVYSSNSSSVSCSCHWKLNSFGRDTFSKTGLMSLCTTALSPCSFSSVAGYMSQVGSALIFNILLVYFLAVLALLLCRPLSSCEWGLLPSCGSGF